jgi:hypothetical protein
VLRVLLRVVVLSALVAVGWLLGSGLSHADEDPGLPGANLISAVNAQPANGAAGSIVERALSTTSAPRLAVQPTKKIGILRPIVRAVGGAKPLTDVLAPVPRPLSRPAAHHTAMRPAAPIDKVAPVSPTAPAIAPPAGAAAAVPDAPATPVRHVTPAAVLCAPAAPATQPVPAQLPVRDDPVSPTPASPPGSTPPTCAVGSTSSGANTKNAPDFAVHDSAAASNLALPDGPLQIDGSDPPRSLAVQPSTSPD